MAWEHRVTTAGAFVWTRGRLAFMVGPNAKGDRLGVVRLGGHCERGETSQTCAAREVMEEATMAIRLLHPPVTYFAGAPLRLPGEPLPTIDWPDKPAPVLVTQRADTSLAALYLAVSNDPPVPAAESQGILLPDRDWFHRICTERLTLEEYLAGGGQAVLRTAMDRRLVLEPSYQLRLFDRLLEQHSELVPG